MKELLNYTIQDLVGQRHEYASVLYHYGIPFFQHEEKTLAEVCREKGMNEDFVLKRLDYVSEQDSQPQLPFNEYSIEIILNYLIRQHSVFIKYKLPFMGAIIRNTSAQSAGNYRQIIQDLKFVFPHFAKDFIGHIYEEEDTLFHYITMLRDYYYGRLSYSKVYYAMEKYSIRDFALEHDMDDDEMAGIRELTNNYDISEASPLTVKILFSELKTFEGHLIHHANIENQVLFPKALSLEQEIAARIRKKISYN